MNQNYVHTITLYNRIRAADSPDKKERWKRTVLRDCFWKATTNTSFGDKEANISNTYVVRIPQDARYVPYHVFVKSPDGHFTVSQGDIVVHGECSDEITGEAGKTAAQLIERYRQEAFRVSAFSDNTAFPIDKHYRLGG